MLIVLSDEIETQEILLIMYQVPHFLESPYF